MLLYDTETPAARCQFSLPGELSRCNRRHAYACNTIPLGGVFGRHVALGNYVCTNCGFLESYINSPGDLEKIRAHWPKI